MRTGLVGHLAEKLEQGEVESQAHLERVAWHLSRFFPESGREGFLQKKRRH